MMAICKEDIESLILSLQKAFSKRGFNKAILGLSGGIDSAVVAVLCKRARLDLDAIIMPSSASSQSSIDDSVMLCKEFEIDYEIISLSDFEGAFERNFECYDLLQKGNFCARMRMIILYHLSSLRSALVLGTTNKSELMLGYGTIHGDLAHAINPLGRFYKTQVYEIARLLCLPEIFITKKPSADLYDGQSDEAEIGYSYNEIDRFLESFLQCDGDVGKISGFSQEMISSLSDRILKNAFKRELPYILEV